MRHLKSFLRDIGIGTIVLLFLAMLMLPLPARPQDVQYSRDRHGNLAVQINPGARATGPYRNIVPITTPGYSLSGSVGASVPKLVQEMQPSPVILPPSRPAYVIREYVYWHVPDEEEPRSKPYMKICRHVEGEVVCKEFDMGRVTR